MKTIAPLLFLTVVLLTSCSSVQSISNGGFSDISLNRNSNEYELTRLNEITAEGEALFGIPFKAKKRQGTVVRFNGINLGKSSQILPILTMIGYTFITGTLVSEVAGTNENGEDKFKIPINYAIGLPFAAVLNNLSWSGSALQNATWDLNSQLLEENPDVDIFLNPKYEIEFKQGIFNQKAKVTAKVMGATIKTD